MITNQQQYELSQKHAQNFRKAIADLATKRRDIENIDPRRYKAAREGYESLLEELLSEIREYELLTLETAPVIEIDESDKLPLGLIKARITAGLSQQELARKLGMETSELIKCEVDEYAGLGYDRLIEIADALNLRVRHDIRVPFEVKSFNDIVKKVNQAGLSRKFLFARILENGSKNISSDTPEPENNEHHLTHDFYETMRRIFGWAPESFRVEAPLPIPKTAGATSRFKMPAFRKQNSTSVYTVYAHYLGMILLKATKNLPASKVPSDPRKMRRKILEKYDKLTLSSCLNMAWDLGVAVLPLNDSGAFHGACWRHEKRSVIVLKQKSPFPSFWLFDLLHELYHASQYPELDTFAVIEADETAVERRESPEESRANDFARDIIFDGRAEKLVKKCVERANKNVSKLGQVIRTVSIEENVDPSLLANHLAYRLSLQGINWWGSAIKIQDRKTNAWKVAKDVLIERSSGYLLTEIDKLDKSLIEKALREG